jgi:hypothetical protein
VAWLSRAEELEDRRVIRVYLPQVDQPASDLRSPRSGDAPRLCPWCPGGRRGACRACGEHDRASDGQRFDFYAVIRKQLEIARPRCPKLFVTCENATDTINKAVLCCAQRDDPLDVVRVDARDELANRSFRSVHALFAHDLRAHTVDESLGTRVGHASVAAQKGHNLFGSPKDRLDTRVAVVGNRQ